MTQENLLFLLKNLNKRLRLKSELKCKLFVGIENNDFLSFKSEIDILLRSPITIIPTRVDKETDVFFFVEGVIVEDIPPEQSIHFHCNINDLKESLLKK